MIVRNCSVRAMSAIRKMTLAKGANAKKESDRKASTKIWLSICLYCHWIQWHKKKNGIYKPFKWDNDDITRDLCARYCICTPCIDEEMPMTMEFLLSLYQRQQKLLLRDQMRWTRAFMSRLFHQMQPCMVFVHISFISPEILFNKRHSTTDMLALVFIHFLLHSGGVFIGSSFVLLEFIAITLAAVQSLESHSMECRLHLKAIIK